MVEGLPRHCHFFRFLRFDEVRLLAKPLPQRVMSDCFDHGAKPAPNTYLMSTTCGRDPNTRDIGREVVAGLYRPTLAAWRLPTLQGGRQGHHH